MKPDAVLQASDLNWRRELRSSLERGESVVIVNPTSPDFGYARALGQEFDCCCLVLDKGEELEGFRYAYEWGNSPVAPKTIALVHKREIDETRTSGPHH